MKYKISNNDPTVLSRQPAMHEQVLSRQLKALGSKGGKARAIKLTSDQRTEIATKAATIRWFNKKETKMESVKHKIAAHKNAGTDVNIQFTPAEVEHLHHLTHTQHIQKESNGPVRSK